MQAGFGVIFDILSGDDGFLRICLLWMSAQRMMGRFNDLYNTSQQCRLILVLFPQVHCNQSSRVDDARGYLLTGHLLLGSTHHYIASLFHFQLSGIVLVAWSSSEVWGKELCVRPEAVPLLSQFLASQPGWCCLFYYYYF